MRNKFVAIAAAVAAGLAGLIGVQPTTAMAAPSTPAVLTAAQGNNILGKPLPALDYAHASKGGVKANKGRFVPITNKSFVPIVAPKNVASTTTSSTNYFYAGGKQVVVADGAAVTASVAQPVVPTADYHSLFEIAIQSADAKQVVEWGWTVDRVVNGGSNTPHLFAFRWVNDVPGTYNGLGWVPAVGSTCPAGMDISADIGTTKNFAIQHINTMWWMAYGSSWCGGIQDSEWTGASPGVTFNQSGQIQPFGEVAAASTTPTGLQMGDGSLGSSSTTGTGAKAYSFALVNPTPTGTAPSLTMRSNPNPTHYNGALITGSVRSFRWGGTW